MTKAANSFHILSRFGQTQVYLDHVRRAADTHKEELGFLPGKVYDEFARKECLYVLVADTPQGSKYAGHLIFSQSYPTAKVIQMYTDPGFRRNGAATTLLNRFKAELTDAGFTSIYAGVAEDLATANAFWERQQFHVQRIKKGGESRKRVILHRCHELDSPQLFPRSGLNKHNPLGLQPPKVGSDLLFLLDLNVVFDLAGPRRARHEKAVGLFQAERSNLCRLAISDELRTELKETATPGKIDPMEGFIDILPEVPLRKYDPLEPLLAELHALVFPEKEKLSRNDKSDLRHIATAVQHGLAGLITNDESVLSAARSIKDKYGIELISPDAFMAARIEPQTNTFEGHEDFELRLHHVDNEHSEAIHALLKVQGVPTSQVTTAWLPTGLNTLVATRFGVWATNELVGYITWSNALATATVLARMAVNTKHAAAADAARIMLTFLIDRLPAETSAARIDLELPGSQPAVREAAIKLGFRGASGQEGLYKVALGGVLTAHTWAVHRERLERNNGVRLPDQIPHFHGPDQQIAVIGSDGDQRFITLDDLESLLAPALFCLPGRPAVITPIRRGYAEPLLGHSAQTSFLPSPRATLFRDRHYICAPTSLRHFKRGTLMFFYESTRNGGRAALVAMARVRQAYLKHCNDLGDEDFEQSVLNGKTIKIVGKSVLKTVTVFDNIFVLSRAVPLKTLVSLGCGSATNLLTTKPISFVQTQAILQEAFSND
ncbi:GNAT family N-acetyltransferase [Thiobacillus sedimenti]|uniref:GNAT family N-acetyltransferase n=1 Tax=Thiobacillus sedimenti TaxID=3110231 RepID=A0ABZ1CLK8_9PROT|nr:GNAT family N-acetyltransferase [Thiobacillus sp. SCUT-2]WRS40162.1 GNAT family N-acetyltransferase [Thiobacillus sp. SCUT-2]